MSTMPMATRAHSRPVVVVIPVIRDPTTARYAFVLWSTGQSLIIIIVLLFRLLVRIVLLIWLGLLIIQPQVDEDVGHVVLQGSCEAPALLSELGVVCHCILHLLLLRAKGDDAVR